MTEFPYDIPFVRNLSLEFRKPVTFFVGENGSGKSTLVEAIAEACRLPIWGGSRNEAANPNGPDRRAALGSALRFAFLRRPAGRPLRRFCRNARAVLDDRPPRGAASTVGMLGSPPCLTSALRSSVSTIRAC